MAAGFALALTVGGSAGGTLPDPAPQVSASATPAELSIGVAVTVSGMITAGGRPLPRAPLGLESEPYPFRHVRTIARTSSAPDGSFSFTGITPDRNTRLRVVAEGAAPSSSSDLAVVVDPSVALGARRLRPGATRLSVRIGHTPEGRPRSVRVIWFTAPRGTSVFRPAAVTPTRELAPGVSYASAVVEPPSRRFVFRVCLNPGWERAMGRPAARGPCPEHAFRLGSGAA